MLHRLRNIEEENNDGTWEFDTVRARPSLDDSRPLDFLSIATADDTPNATIRPPPSKVPPTLRMLFEDAGNPSEPFKFPGLDTPIPAALTPSLLPPPSGTPAFRGRGRSRSAASPIESDDDVLTAKQPTFQFPSRSATPRTARKMTLVDDFHDDDDHLSFTERHPPLGPGIPSGRSPSRQSSRQPSPLSSPLLVAQQPEAESSEVVIPPLGDAPVVQKGVPPPIVFSASSPDRTTTQATRPPLNRGRSQSSAMDSPSFMANHDWNFSSPSPSTFQFPPPGFSQPSTPPPLTAPVFKTHNRVSPTHASASTISTASRTSHQFTHSLDASVVPRRYQSPGSLPTPPPMARSRSAVPFGEPNSNGLGPSSNGPEAVILQAAPRKPSMTRLPSLPIMETIHTPTRQFTFGRVERSGSLDTGHPLPGLKDVLKVIHDYF